MSAIFDTQNGPQPGFDRNSIPLKFGLMSGFISMFATTICFLYFLKINYLLFMVTMFLTFLIPVIFFIVTGVKQRKAMGGFIEVKDAFRAIFIVILISTIISSIYGLIYAKFIDPEAMTRVKENTLAFFERMNMPQEQIDEQMARMDKEIADSTSAGKLLYATAKNIVIQSIIGLICALIIKKTPQNAQ